MRKNDKSRPRNWCVVQAQLSVEDAKLFHRLMDDSGCTTSDIVKIAIHDFLKVYKAMEKHYAKRFIEYHKEEQAKQLFFSEIEIQNDRSGNNQGENEK